MLYRQYPPHPALMPYVKCYWSITAEGLIDLMCCKPFLAEGFEFSFNLGDTLAVASGDCSVETSQGACITGPMTRPAIVRPSGRLEVLGVCFRPGGAYHFFPYPAAELVDWCGDAGDLPGAESLPVERIRNNCLTKESRIEEIDAFLTTLLRKRNLSEDLRLAQALGAIESSRGRISVGRLSGLAGLSIRQLERLFKERIGIMPKQLCRNLRFKQLFNCLTKCPPDRLASIAAACGYYDQSHMISEFKYYTGKSPAAFFDHSVQTRS